MKEDLLEIINHFGLEHQLVKLSEEVTELILAIATYDGSKEAFEHIEEEYGDVENVLNQFRFKLDLNYSNIMKSREYKNVRTLKIVRSKTDDNNQNNR